MSPWDDYTKKYNSATQIDNIKLYKDNNCSGPIGRYIGKVDAVDGDMIEVKLDSSIPTWGVKSWDEPYPWSWYDVPEARLITTKSRWCGWDTYTKDLGYIEARLDNNGNIYYTKPLKVYGDNSEYYYQSPKEVVDDIVKHYNIKSETQTEKFTIGKDFPEYSTIPGWKMMELSVVKKPFNSEGYIK